MWRRKSRLRTRSSLLPISRLFAARRSDGCAPCDVAIHVRYRLCGRRISFMGVRYAAYASDLVRRRQVDVERCGERQTIDSAGAFAPELRCATLDCRDVRALAGLSTAAHHGALPPPFRCSPRGTPAISIPCVASDGAVRYAPCGSPDERQTEGSGAIPALIPAARPAGVSSYV
jgi:hypothetical protein